MAFFSSSHAYGTPLRRKRSTSTTRERKDSAAKEAPRNHDPSVFVSPVTPALPATPVSTDMSRAQTAVASFADPDVSGYDQSSTPIPFIKSVSHNLPPNLIIDGPSSSQSSSASAEPVLHREHRSLPKTRVAASSSPSPRSAHNRSKAWPQFGPVKISNDRRNFLDMSAKKMPDESSQPSWLLSQAPSSNPRPSPAAEHRPHRSLPTPIYPPQHVTMDSADPTTPLATPSGHARSRSPVELQIHAAPNFASASAHGFTTSSRRHTPTPLNIFSFDSGSGSGSESWSGSDNSTPTVNAMQQLKHPRNILRKPSATSRQRSAASDGERKAHMQTKASAGLSSASRRNRSATASDVEPFPAEGLTPTEEIFVAYKESQHRPVSDTKFVSSGKVVALGSPDDDALGASRSPWTAGWLMKSSQEGADERGEGEGMRGGLRKTLSKKFSERGVEKDPERLGPRPQEESLRRSASARAMDISRRKAGRHTVGERSATFPKCPRARVSPTHERGVEQFPDEEEGRVWEEEVGDWMSLQSRSRDDLDTDASSPSRLWKIVKRFGGSNLKEKYNPLLEAPPPMPPLPRDVMQDRTGHADDDVGPSAPTNRVTNLGVVHTRRRAMTLSSSSASETGFFPRSRTSSASSFGDMFVSPVPDAQVGRYIVPHRRYHNRNSEEGSLASEPSPGASVTTHKLPLPSPTASIPAFEAQDPVNSFSPFKRTHAHLPDTTHFPDPEPPTLRREQTRWPLPPRSHRRPNLSAPAFPPPRQHSMPDVTLVQDARVDVPSGSVPRSQQGPDSEQGSVAPARSISDGADPVESTLRYRVMSETQRQLTEQEKNAKWEDLLQRSDLAGGTLHVGSPTTGTLSLWSDRASVAFSEGL